MRNANGARLVEWSVFSEFMFPLLDRSLSMGACLRSVCSVDIFQSSTHTLKSAILTLKLQSRGAQSVCAHGWSE